MDTFTLGYRRVEGSEVLVPFTTPTHILILKQLEGFRPGPQLIDTNKAWRSWTVGMTYPNGYGKIWPHEIDEHLVNMAKRGAQDMETKLPPRR
jgi:hypothetical protein